MLLYLCDVLFICLILCNDVLTESEPEYVAKTVKAFTGKTITFDCRAPDAQAGDVIAWYHEGEPLSTGGSILEEEEETAERFSITVMDTYYNLTISDLEIGDEGEYECKMERSGSEPVPLRLRILVVSKDDSTNPLDIFAIMGLVSGILLILGIVGAIAWKNGRNRGEVEGRVAMEG